MAWSVVAAHRACRATEGSVVHHAGHRVVTPHIAQDFLNDVDFGARRRGFCLDHTRVLGIFQIQRAHMTEGAALIEVQNDHLLLGDPREIRGRRHGHHGDINPCVVIERGACGRRAKKIDGICAVAAALFQLFVIVCFNQGTAWHGG